MKTRFLTFIARCFLAYQLVKFVKILTRIIRLVTEQRMGVERNRGPRTVYRR